MKKLLLSALSLLLMAGVASANWSLRQKGDGGTYWANDKDTRESHVLETYLTVDVSNITIPSSAFVISPIAGVIEKIYVVVHEALGQGPNETVSFFVSSATSGTMSFANNVNEVTNAVSRLTLVGATPHVVGDMREFTPTATTSRNVVKGGRIGISNNGTSADNADGVRATFTIIINPK